MTQLPLGAGVMFLGILILLIWGILRPKEGRFSIIDVYFFMGIILSFLSGYYLMTLECRPYC